jgi:hypothetical protein
MMKKAEKRLAVIRKGEQEGQVFILHVSLSAFAQDHVLARG